MACSLFANPPLDGVPHRSPRRVSVGPDCQSDRVDRLACITCLLSATRRQFTLAQLNPLDGSQREVFSDTTLPLASFSLSQRERAGVRALVPCHLVSLTLILPQYCSAAILCG